MRFRPILFSGVLMTLMGMVGSSASAQAPDDDLRTVAALDSEYQLAVKTNDFATMDRILHAGFVLVLGDGRAVSREALFANERQTTYEQQDEEPGTQTVRLYGDTAIVTAKLWLKGMNARGPFDRTLWFSDTYVRTESGWRYVFGQASLPLTPPTTASPRSR